MEDPKLVQVRRKCGKCYWYSEGWCGCLYGQHDKQRRDPSDKACGDWAAKDAKRGVLACGMVWRRG